MSKGFRSHHSILTTRIKLNRSNFSWIHKRGEDTGQTTAPRLEKRVNMWHHASLEQRFSTEVKTALQDIKTNSLEDAQYPKSMPSCPHQSSHLPPISILTSNHMDSLCLFFYLCTNEITQYIQFVKIHCAIYLRYFIF